jgi:hypothetical protein
MYSIDDVGTDDATAAQRTTQCDSYPEAYQEAVTTWLLFWLLESRMPEKDHRTNGLFCPSSSIVEVSIFFITLHTA